MASSENDESVVMGYRLSCRNNDQANVMNMLKCNYNIAARPPQRIAASANRGLRL